jgi:hypothetical protein
MSLSIAVGARRSSVLPRPGHHAGSMNRMLSYDPNSVSQEKGRLLTERSGGPSLVGLGQSEAEAEVAHRATPFSQVAAGGGGGSPPRYGTGHKYPLGFSIRD